LFRTVNSSHTTKLIFILLSTCFLSATKYILGNWICFRPVWTNSMPNAPHCTVSAVTSKWNCLMSENVTCSEVHQDWNTEVQIFEIYYLLWYVFCLLRECISGDCVSARFAVLFFFKMRCIFNEQPLLLFSYGKDNFWQNLLLVCLFLVL
jgi:hypothetical protein